MGLTGLRIRKSFPFARHAWVNGELDVRRKLENTLRRIRVESLWVHSDVPNAWSGILRIKSSLRIKKALLTGSMSSDQGGETMWFDCFVFEKFDETFDIGIHIGKQIINGGSGIVFATNAAVKISHAHGHNVEERTYKDRMRGPRGQATVATVAPIWMTSAIDTPYGWYLAYLIVVSK
jgi:hypothetical protein